MSKRVSPVADQDARERALDIRRSFIVRAPAGSGKTRLLIQRYLSLLARVDEPEEITAITFTRKAAAEMRARVLRAFASATTSECNDDNFDDVTTRELAREALARDAVRGWQIANTPSRLRIQTIDSMNASITRQMPVTARFGAQPESVDDASALYREAARNVLAQVNAGDAVADDVAILLAHLDNNLAVAESLLADMLRSRDHWLRNLPTMHERDALEAGLVRVRAETVSRVAALYPFGEKGETLALARYAGQNRPGSAVDAGVCDIDAIVNFPADDAEAMPVWLRIADLLLTKDGSWRKRRGLNKNTGFPSSSNKAEKALLDAWKNRMGDLLERFASGGPHGERLLAALGQLRVMPPAEYTDSQWVVLGAIVRLLPYATAQLWSVFASQGQCDFTEISQAAARALGDDGAPTDLALALDYRIRHLLIDEFQDTSLSQFELLEKLTRGWSEGDGRTLMAVGDPMQSIYRFREAEVGLFMSAARAGIGSVSLQPLTLQVNFRSESGVVDWVNDTFSQIMPSVDEAGIDDVPYAPSIAYAASAEESPTELPAMMSAVVWHPQLVRMRTAGLDANADEPEDAVTIASAGEVEAQRVVDIIRARRQSESGVEIAILVRNRGHLQDIVPALKAADIPFRAVDIDPLKECPVVVDLLSLTRALLHLADRIAWLAVLRAPWCGLTLNDLASLTNGAEPVEGALAPDARTVWQMLCDGERTSTLSADGQMRVARVCAVLASALRLRRRLPLRELVESTWFALLGPACLPQARDLNDAVQFLDLLETEAQAQAGGSDIIDLATLESGVEKLFASSFVSGDGLEVPAVQIMTIHKAKGLEFDTVIVPGLHRPPRQDDRKLLVWTEQLVEEHGGSELLLAPIRETGAGEETDAIYRYVRQCDRYKQQQEDVRLLYVAATRAEHRLHLLATVMLNDVGDDGGGVARLVPPRGTSLLASLWPAVSGVFLDEPNVRGDALQADGFVPAQNCSARGLQVACRAMRVSAMQPMPNLPISFSRGARDTADKVAPQNGAIDFDWASETARHVGTVVHAYLQFIAEDGLDRWNVERVAASTRRFGRELERLGVANAELPTAAGRVAEALMHTLSDSRGRWILEPHPNACSEWCVTGLAGDSRINVAIDRSFVDENGVRWIIDFKTGSHEGADVDAFLDNEKRRYREQLETYAKLLRAMHTSLLAPAVKLGLYFPLLGGWREWDWQPE
ncbi:MAG: UvrD-helicase domain-containing protein [Betaproteobacteria bacterium]|nr:UvrD-helicase domain-containing protein [Betaproteobacteria bacterium]